jgi:NMD protein affecting ribosome stability and mRNA decay
MNCEECRKEFLESEEDSFVSITAVIHRFFCPDCRREIEEFGRAIELLRDDPDAEAPEDLSRIVLAAYRSRRGKNPFRRW